VGIVICSIVVALVAGRLAGGRLSSFERLPAHGLLLPLAALGILFVGVVLGWVGLPAGSLYAVALGLSALLVGCFALVNRSVTGTGLIAVGLLLNALVVGLNGALPVSAYAAARAGVGARAVADQRYEEAGSHTHLRFLGDVIPVPLPLRPEVDSIGDLLAAAGLGQLVFMAMRPAGRRETQPGDDTSVAKLLSSSD
jgi:hypothetical protein